MTATILPFSTSAQPTPWADGNINPLTLWETNMPSHGKPRLVACCMGGCCMGGCNFHGSLGGFCHSKYHPKWLIFSIAILNHRSVSYHDTFTCKMPTLQRIITWNAVKTIWNQFCSSLKPSTTPLLRPRASTNTLRRMVDSKTAC